MPPDVNLLCINVARFVGYCETMISLKFT